MGTAIQSAIEELDQLPDHRHYGCVDSVLGRAVAVFDCFPTVDILRSMPRSLPACNDDTENRPVARKLLSTNRTLAEPIRIGADKRATDPAIDEAIHDDPPDEAFRKREKSERAGPADGDRRQARIFGPGRDENRDVADNKSMTAGAAAGSEIDSTEDKKA